MSTQIQLRRGTAAEWTAADPTLAIGEVGIETDTNKIKIGDGATAWSSLPYLDIGHLGDVDTATAAPAVGDALVFDGTKWVPDNATYAEAGEVGLLSSVGYKAASDSSYTTTSSTFVDVDATNLVLPDFVVPSSGRVLVKMSAMCSAPGTATLRWNIRQGSSDIADTINIVMGNAENLRMSYAAIVTGLTPGATISGWKMGFRSNGTDTVTIWHGGASRGQIVMEVWAA